MLPEQVDTNNLKKVFEYGTIKKEDNKLKIEFTKHDVFTGLPLAEEKVEINISDIEATQVRLFEEIQRLQEIKDNWDFIIEKATV